MTWDFETFFDEAIDLLCITGTDGHFRRINPAFERVLGWSVEELLSHPLIEFVHPEDVAATTTVLQHLVDGEPILEFENRCRCKDGTFRHLRWNAAPQPGGELFFAIARDADRARLSQVVVSEREGVKDRPTFDDRLEMLMKLGHRMGGSLSLLLLEVDHFDELNESFGPSAAFEVLNELSALLVDNARKSDVVARYLGERFAIILPDTPATGATQFAERLRAVIRAHEWEQGTITVSVGASTLRFRKGNSSQHFEQKHKLIEDAERALAHVKTSGCNRSMHAADLSEVAP